MKFVGVNPTELLLHKPDSARTSVVLREGFLRVFVRFLGFWWLSVAFIEKVGLLEKPYRVSKKHKGCTRRSFTCDRDTALFLLRIVHLLNLRKKNLSIHSRNIYPV